VDFVKAPVLYFLKLLREGELGTTLARICLTSSSVDEAWEQCKGAISKYDFAEDKPELVSADAVWPAPKTALSSVGI